MITKTLTLDTQTTAKGFSATVSTEAVDRVGDVMVAQGMLSKNYELNPVLLWGHDDKHEAPVGQCTNIRRRPASIEMDFVLDPRPKNYVGEWLPDRLGGAVAAKSLRGVSIRFAPLPGGVRRANAADKAKYGPECEQVYAKWELLEVSLVSIPCNQEALIYAVQKGLKARTTEIAPLSAPKRHQISVSVPLVGKADIERIAREEFARASGRLWF